MTNNKIPQSCSYKTWLGYPGVVAVVVPLPLDRSDVAVSTHYPPCEQWLAAVEVGAGDSRRLALLSFASSLSQ
jgi:hypothetical protein